MKVASYTPTQRRSKNSVKHAYMIICMQIDLY